MIRRRFALIFFLVILASSGCSGLQGKSLPTFIPEDHLPTVIEMTAQALVDAGLVTPPPTWTIDPLAVTATPEITDTPTITLTPQDSPTPTLNIIMGTPEPVRIPDPLPQAEIRIISPGRLSRVLTPLQLHIYLVPPTNDKGEELAYQITLYGENGRLVNRETITRSPGDSAHLVMDLDFDIFGEAESARLEVSSVDPWGRVISMATTDVILLSGGDEEIKAILDLNAALIVQQPIPSTLIQGGALIVQGVTRIAPGDELLVECVNRDGSLVGSAVIEVDEDDLGQGYRSFEGEIPFQVGSSSWIRVQIIARDGIFSGIQTLTSVEVLVSP